MWGKVGEGEREGETVTRHGARGETRLRLGCSCIRERERVRSERVRETVYLLRQQSSSLSIAVVDDSIWM